MARLIFMILVLFSGTVFAADENPLLGKWQFMSIRYKGDELPRPNPNLILTFDFGDDGIDTLRWSREGESGFCERKARYTFDGANLSQEVFWINPDNAAECAKDPDMRPDVKTVTPMRKVGEKLEMDFNLNTDPLTYIWEKISPLSTSP